MTIPTLLIFGAVYFLAVASPGPGLAAVVARGLGQGLAAGPAFIAGFVVGDLIWFTFAATGLTVLAQNFEAVFIAIRYLGCAYLLYLAFRMWRQPAAAADLKAAQGRMRPWPSFLGSLMLTLGNPKAMVFFLSIMPLVIDPRQVTPQLFAQMALIIVLVMVPVLAGVLIMADRARLIFRSERALRRIRRGSAAVMAGAAGAIILRG